MHHPPAASSATSTTAARTCCTPARPSCRRATPTPASPPRGRAASSGRRSARCSPTPRRRTPASACPPVDRAAAREPDDATPAAAPAARAALRPLGRRPRPAVPRPRPGRLLPELLQPRRPERPRPRRRQRPEGVVGQQQLPRPRRSACPTSAAPGVSLPQLEDRASLLRPARRAATDAATTAPARLDAWDVHRQQALRAAARRRGPAAATRSTCRQEPDRVRDLYGREEWGQGFLVARRLVEAGVRMVQVNLRGWDTHQNAFRDLKGKLLPSHRPLPERLPRRPGAARPARRDAGGHVRRDGPDAADLADHAPAARTPRARSSRPAGTTGATCSRASSRAAASGPARSSARPTSRAACRSRTRTRPRPGGDDLPPAGHRPRRRVPRRPGPALPGLPRDADCRIVMTATTTDRRISPRAALCRPRAARSARPGRGHWGNRPASRRG